MADPLVAGLWLANVVVDTAGQLAFKAAAVHPESTGTAGVGARWRALASRGWLWLGVACYVIEFVVWLAFLSLVPLSDGVLLGCVNIVAVMVAGRVLFREHLAPLRVLGILLVAGGVALVGLA
ncbi:EamA family transporter [Ramlibacter humi]|uniref:Uncharacterized protein n=1 Tax=Ramlibacter humi TaxID=2530451 RepID=A0A4Z0CCU5_9BURK|nr:EamA family transporter [Ramlibacter humi]TFZ08762.1 hypothetical protein EZ216_06355 [Ramlibacter humi]